mgnify:CR=1 FL=1
MSTLARHCVLIEKLGLIDAIFETLPGSWQQYFVDANEEDKQSSKTFGEFGEVVLVKDKRNGADYALKLFKKELKLAEKQRIALLLHFSRNVDKKTWPSSLVRYEDAYEFTNPPQKALLMERIDGISLQTLIREGRATVPEEQWKCWMKDILLALQYFHKNGITHRDVHPGNIMIRNDGKSAVLIDLDLMCIPATSEQCGTLCFSPALANSTSPDLWCLSDVVAASSEPKKWYRSDVWATANSFLSYLNREDGYLTKKLPYMRRDQQTCVRMPDALVREKVDKSLLLLQRGARVLFSKMLDPDWEKRPSAKSAARVLGRCSDRSSFNLPPPLKTASDNILQEGVYQ